MGFYNFFEILGVDNDDDLWECLSGDGVEIGIDLDICDDNSLEILKR